jgi:hypothetical protein
MRNVEETSGEQDNKRLAERNAALWADRLELIKLLRTTTAELNAARADFDRMFVLHHGEERRGP